MTSLAKESWFTAQWPAPDNIRTCITSRNGGFSQKPWDSFNLAAHVEDNPQHVDLNRKLLNQLLPVQPQWLEQNHTTHCIELPADNNLLNQVDGAMTIRYNTPCVVLTADCLPLLICSKDGFLLAALHAGWKGLAAGIIENSFSRFYRQYQQKPQQFMVWLGPAISQKAFEVGAEVRQAFLNKYSQAEQAFIETGIENKYMADIYQLAGIILRSLGVNDIYGGDFCTYTENSRFYSYRRDRITGRMASIIWKEE